MPFVPDQPTAGGATAGFIPDVSRQIVEEPKKKKKRGILSRYQETISRTARKSREAMQRTLKFQQTLPETFVQQAGIGIGAVGDIAMETITGVARAALPETTEQKINEGISKLVQGPGISPNSRLIQEVNKLAERNPKLQRFAQNLRSSAEEGGGVIAPALTEVQDWAKKNPKDAANLSAAFEVAGIVPVGKGATIAARKAGETALGRAAVETAEQATKRLTSEVGEVAAKKIAQREAKIAIKTDELVGSIIQGKRKDRQSALSALRKLDTKGVKTYGQLETMTGERIGTLSRKVDELLDVDQSLLQLDDLTKTTTVGKRKVEQNFVREALDNLEELYIKTGASEDLARIQNLSDDIVDNGITRRGLNNLAREYGIEFGSKAFSKRTGDALTSVNAQKFENIRKGIKDTLRKQLPDESTRVIDKEISDLFSLRDNVSTAAEKVNTIAQKIQKRSVAQKLGRVLGEGVNLATGGAAKGFLQKLFLESNIGLKSMNFLDLESRLSKNLQQLDKMLDQSDDDMIDLLLKKAAELKEKGIDIEALELEEAAPLVVPTIEE